MKSLFCLALKTFFIFNLLKFLSCPFAHVKKRLDWKDRVNFKIHDVTIAIHKLPNILRSKGHKAMKFGQIIEYNMRNIFLENHTQNVVERLFPDPFLKTQN